MDHFETSIPNIPVNFNPLEEMRKAKAKALEQMQTTGIPNPVRQCPNCKTMSQSQFCGQCGAPTKSPIQLTCSCCGYDVEMAGILPRACPACGHTFDGDDLVM